MPRPSPSYRVRLPGLSDVFHTIPDAARDPDELAEYRRDRASLIADSPVPWVVRGFQDILTRIDDVQDAAVTLSVATRLAAPSLGPLAPLAKTTALAADFLNLSNLTRTSSLLTSSRKGSLFRAASKYRDSYSYRTKQALAGKPIPISYAEALQALQTADQVLGIGLALGPIMGVPIDLLSTALYGGTIEVPTTQFAALATIAPTFFAANPWVRFGGLAAGFAASALLDRNSPIVSIPIPRLLPLEEQDTSELAQHPSQLPSATALEWAADTLSSSIGLFGIDQPISVEDHWAATTAQMQAIAILWPFWLTQRFWHTRREYFPLEINARPLAARYSNTYAARELRSIAARPALALPGNPPTSPTTTLPDAITRRTIPGPLGWIFDHPDDPRAEAASALAHQAAPLILGALGGFHNLEGPIPSPIVKRGLRIAEGKEPPATPEELKSLAATPPH